MRVDIMEESWSLVFDIDRISRFPAASGQDLAIALDLQGPVGDRIRTNVKRNCSTSRSGASVIKSMKIAVMVPLVALILSGFRAAELSVASFNTPHPTDSCQLVGFHNLAGEFGFPDESLISCANVGCDANVVCTLYATQNTTTLDWTYRCACPTGSNTNCMSSWTVNGMGEWSLICLRAHPCEDCDFQYGDADPEYPTWFEVWCHCWH